MFNKIFQFLASSKGRKMNFLSESSILNSMYISMSSKQMLGCDWTCLEMLKKISEVTVCLHGIKEIVFKIYIFYSVG